MKPDIEFQPRFPLFQPKIDEVVATSSDPQDENAIASLRGILRTDLITLFVAKRDLQNPEDIASRFRAIKETVERVEIRFKSQP